jgi:hypothetical protein
MVSATSGCWSRSSGNSGMKAFLVVHHEIMGTQGDCRVDEMVFDICSSLNKALDFIRKSDVVRWWWWEVQVQDLDSRNWPEHLGYFGRRGGKFAKPPDDECFKIFKQADRANSATQ